MFLCSAVRKGFGALLQHFLAETFMTAGGGEGPLLTEELPNLTRVFFPPNFRHTYTLAAWSCCWGEEAFMLLRNYDAV